MADIGSIEHRLLVFGGPYSNLAATLAMRERAEALGIDAGAVICTGDIVAYCAEPAATVELIRDWGIHVVMGNCEESLGFSEPDCGCGFAEGSSCSTLALAWYAYADSRVDAAQRRWMRELPRQVEFRMAGLRFRVVHGGVDSINQFVFASTDAAAKLAQIHAAQADVIVGGHAGIPFGQTVEDRHWLNAGVIGMPANDGTTDGWYMLLETGADGARASWHRLQYDHRAASRATIASGMPEYGQALADGLWPSQDILPPTERSRRGRQLNLEPVLLSVATQRFGGTSRSAVAGTARD